MNKELSANTTLSHYRIVSKIGEGGMGEVWLAEDTRLGRKVALKLLPAEFTEDSDRVRRFTLEAKAASALNHPNIIAVYDIGECETGRFIVMEFVAGSTLRTVIAKDNSLETLFTLGGQMAKALSAAHTAGITHRDIKPDNIMVRDDGYVKMLDFGLARLHPTTSSDPEAMTLAQQTTPGTVMGTLAYMSPEQATGQTVGSASDVFALGIVLYELATGSHPFKSETMIGYLHAITSRTPPSMTSIKSHLPPALDDLILRMLEKDASQRPIASEVAQALQEIEKYGSSNTLPLRIVAEKPKPKRGDEGCWLAVLPFKVRDTEPDVAVLADGLFEEVVTGLSRFRYLSVVTSASAVHLTGNTKDERALSAKLGTRYVLEGSIRKGGSVIRVSVQLVDTETGAQLWSETYNRDLQASTVFAAQDDVAGRIVATVADSYGVLVHSMRAAIRKKDDVDLTPVEWQFQYFAYREQITPSAHAALKSRLLRVAEQNVGQSDVWACLAQIYVDEYAFGFQGDATSLDRALAAGRRAVELDRANQFALVALAQVHFFRQDIAAFGPAAERGMALNPLNTDAIGILGLQIVHTGQFERGTTIVRRAMELNPNHAGWMHFAPLWDHFHKGEYEQALECANRVDVPGLFWPYLVMASACGHLGRRAEAEAAIKDLLAIDPEFAAHVRSNVESWHFASGLLEPLLEGLRKAGLEITGEESTPTSSVLSLPSSETRATEGFRVAVLPFKASGSAVEINALAEGLSEEIVTGLSRFSYLRVISRNSTLDHAGEASDVRTNAKALGARYVMEGSLRQSGMKLRLAVQLVDTTTGAHLWAENYERAFSAETVFELQDDLAPRIVSTVADQYGALVHSMSESLRGKSAGQYSAHEAAMRTFGYWERMTPEEHAEVRDILEAAVAAAPDHSDCLAELSMIYWHEHAFGYNLRPDPVGRARAAAQRAVAAAPTSHFAHCALATSLFFQKDFLAFRPAAERALALNRMDASTMELLGQMIAYAGDWEYGLKVVERAMELNPHHPGWYHYLTFCDKYRKHDYHGALASALKVNMPAYHWPHVYLAAVYGQLGEQQRASEALRELHALLPNFGAIAREEMGKWLDAELTEHLLEGLHKAGLEIADEDRRAEASSVIHASGEKRADEGFWVAVLPFKATGTDAGLSTLAEGLSEEIITGLNRFSYLRVIARSSTLRYANQASDVRNVGKQLGARYVLEGSLRQAGSVLRVSVQLVDANTGAHVWAETYDRPFRSEEIFAVQDELVPKIVSSVADMHGALPRSMSEVVRKKAPDQLSPYEALLRSFGYNERFTPSELAEVRSCLERAVQEAPSNGDCWAMLSVIYADEYGHWHIHQPDSLDKALTAARTAVQAAPLHSLPYYALAQALFFRKEMRSFRVAAERAVSLNPMDGATAAFMGLLIAYSGDWERGCALSDKGLQLNPNHPGWYRYTAWHDAYRKQDYQGALDIALKLNAPDNFYTHAVLAMCYAQLGHMEAAHKSLRDMLVLKPDYAIVARELHGKWIEPDLVEQLMDGLRKAGLEIGAVEQPVAAFSSTPFVSSEARSDEGFWVAVLPFKFTGSNTEVATLAEGLSEEIVTGLSRFSYLRVISRSSTLRYATETSDVRTVGLTLGARYVLEGSLRIAGSSLRVAVQLVDSSTGAHLWVETYKRSISTDDIFELQDDLASRIVSTVADMNGVLPHTMGEMLRQRDPTTLTPYESVLRAFAFVERLSAEEHVIVRATLERAVEQAPEHSDCLAMLAMIYDDEHKQGFNQLPNSLDRALAMAQRAVAAGPSNHIAHAALAQTLFFRRDLQGFRGAANRALALNPMDAYTTAFMGILIAYSGDWEYGSALAEKGMELNPNHPGWYRFCSFFKEYGKRDYRAALDVALKINMPSYFYAPAALTAAYAQLGELTKAQTALREVLIQVPNFGEVARELYQKWFGPGELLEHVLDGLRKAGLEIPEADALSSTTAVSSETRADEGFWVAVLPFKATGTDAGLSTFAEGLSDEIVTGLNRFSYLRVIARSSTLRYANQTSDVRTVGKTLGARYVMEGNVRQVSSVIRVTVQLVDAGTGAQLWSETYDRAFKPDEIFALQDDLVPRIVSTVADQHGVLPHSMSEAVRAQDPDQLTAYETLLRGFRYYEGVSASEHATIRASFERALETSPGSADCWAMLSIMYCDEHKFGFNPLPDSLDRALNAAQRAVEISPTNPFAYEAFAQALFFRKEFDSFRNAAERAITLNPMDGATNAFMGILIAFTGDWDYGCTVAERATQLNPHHPGWYWNAAFYNAYRKHDYEAALKITLEFNMPGLFYHHVNRAAVYGQLGDREAASKALRELLVLKPDFASAARHELGKWLRPELVDHVIEGLRKAGLEIGEAEASAITSSTPAVSSLSRADEGFWIAVLPFKFTGSNIEVATLAEGLSEEIVTGLSRFSYLRVISRSSTLRYAKETDDVREVGKKLGARYVMEGSLRIAGSSLRVLVQLVDAGSGAHLWAETYDRQFRAEEVFALQDDLVPRIVSTIADVNGVLPRSMCDLVCNKNPDELSPYEAVLRSFRYFDRVSPDELTAARSGLEIAVEKAPNNSDAWAMLALLFHQDYGQGFNLHPDALNLGVLAAQRAVESGPSNHLAYFSLAQARFFQKDTQSFRNAAERAVALNPMDANSVAFMGELLTYVGDFERGLALATRAKEINPNHPGWFWYADYFHAYRQGDYRGALNLIVKANLPGHWGMHAGIAAAAAQLGDSETASKALRDLLNLRPDYGVTVHTTLAKWFDPELCEQLLDGLRKAGLKVADEGEKGRQGEAKIAPSPIHPVAPHAARHTVGREHERNELHAAFSATRDGRGSLLCVAGEPGIGKTTLVEDFLTELTTENQCMIARGKCSERLAGTEAYLPLLEALESLTRGSNPIVAQMMKELAPTWYAQVAPLKVSAELLAEIKAASQERMKRELASFLQAVAQKQSLVVFFDDLHWADVSTIDVLSFLAGKFDSLNALIVTTYRPSDMLLSKHPFLQIKPDLQARGVCRELLLEFLNEAEIYDYLALEFPDNHFPTEFPKLIHQKTEGSPLFMADLVRYLSDKGVIARGTNFSRGDSPLTDSVGSIGDTTQTEVYATWFLAKALPDIERELPETVRGMIERKIAQLSEEDRRLLTVASVQGYQFDSVVIGHVLKLEADEVEERLDKLERVFAFVKLVSEAEFPNRTLTLKYRFVHVLYQNSLYASLRATRKAKLSRDVAQTLEGCYAERSASVANELALLWEAGRECAHAADYFLQAARNAAQINAHREAVQLAERGLEALLKLPEMPERNERELGLQLALGFSLMSIKSWTAPETGAAFDRARQLCEQIGDDPRIFGALVGVWAYHLPRAQFETAHGVCEQMLQLAEQSQDAALLVMATMCRAKIYYFQGDLISARQLVERALALDRRKYHDAYLSVYNEDGGVSARREHSFCLWILGYPDQALALAYEAVSLAEGTCHPFSVGAAHHTTGMVLSMLRDLQSSQKEFDKVFALAEEHALGDILKHATAVDALNLAYEEPTEEALKRAKRAIESLSAHGVMVAGTGKLARMGEAFWMAGRCAEGLAEIAEALTLVERNRERVAEAEIWRIKGELLLKAAGRNAQVEAESCYQKAIDIARQQTAKSWELRASISLGRLWQQQGKTAKARQMLAEIYGWFTEGFATADLKEAKALLDELSDKLQFVDTQERNALALASRADDKLKFIGHSPSIAVLPFVNISNDVDNEYFCDGLAEELLNALSKIESLHVAARTSAFSFKGTPTDIREIGSKLNVSTLLEGSVRKSGNRVRISVQLVNVDDGYHLWSEKYDRQLEDIFDIQDEISLAIVDALKLKLLGAEQSVVKRYTDNTEAYQLYLKGRFFVNQRTSQSLLKAIDYFNQAIALDANYVLGYAGLADAYMVLGVPDAVTEALSPIDSLTKARAAAEKALEIDTSVGEVYAALAHIKWKERDWLGAESDYKRSIELKPHNPIAHFYYAVCLAGLGRRDEAVKEIRRAQELDPLSLPVNASVVYVLYLCRRYDESIDSGKKTLDLDPTFSLTHQRLGLPYIQMKMYREAITEFEQAVETSKRAPQSLVSLAHAYAVSGNNAEAQKVLAELKDLSVGRYVSPYGIATIYVGLNEKELAFEWLEKAFDEANTELTFLKVDPRLDPLREDPRFSELLERVGFTK